MKANDITYKGYSSPNYTPVPDELFDEQLPDLSGAELKVLLYIIRRTFGFKKESDNISLSQMLFGITAKDGTVLDRGTGLSKKTLLETIKSLVRKCLVITVRRRSDERGDEPTTYQLNIVDPQAQKDDPPCGVKTTPGGVVKSTSPGRSRNYTTQETAKQETDIHLRNSKANSQEENEEAKVDAIAIKPISPDLTSATGTQNPRTGESQPPRSGSIHTIGEVLAKHQPAAIPSALTAPVGKLAPTPQIMLAVTEISAEFGDKALRSNTTQAVNIWQASGKSEAVFVSSLYEARSITRQQRGVQHPMPYFWSTVRDLVGLRKELGRAEG